MKKVRIANAGGFWGDWLEAPKRQVLGGQIDYLTIDYLAELTMSMLARQASQHPDRGFVFDFIRMLDELLPEIIKRNIRVVVNAGGVNPRGCAEAVRKVADKHGLSSQVKIGVVSGDNLLPRIPELQSKGERFLHLESGAELSTVQSGLQSANAYIGAQGIVDALSAGANIVLTGRVSDAALTLGPMRYEFGWAADDWDALALGVVTGHILECGAQATGGNCSYDWERIPDAANIGFPIAEVSEDRTAIITKHPNTGGEVTLPSVKEQLLYEIGDPKRYITPDVVADFTSIELTHLSQNQVKVSGVKGSAAPDTLKVSASYAAGYRGEGTLLFSWPDSVKKARAADTVIRERISSLSFDEIQSEYIGYNAAHGGALNIPESDVPEVLLRIAVRGPDKGAVERFARELPPLVLSGPPGISGYAGLRSGAEEIYAYFPTLVRRDNVVHSMEIL